MQDNSGHDQGSASLNVRGIINATLIDDESGGFNSWKVAGTAGGASGPTIDPVRTYYNGLTTPNGQPVPRATGSQALVQSSIVASFPSIRPRAMTSL
jgi:hypothetical protein